MSVAWSGHDLKNEYYADDSSMRNHVASVWMCFIVLFILFIIFTGILGGYHTFLVMAGMTTWEHSSRHRISYMKVYGVGIMPFYQGI